MMNGENRERLSYRIIGAAIEVHKHLGPGLLESVYEAALCAELRLRDINFERQRRIRISYKEQDLGYHVVDLIVENRAIVEVKSVEALAKVHTAQLLTYLKLTGLSAGLLLNFNAPTLAEGLKRVLL